MDNNSVWILNDEYEGVQGVYATKALALAAFDKDVQPTEDFTVDDETGEISIGEDDSGYTITKHEVIAEI